MSESQEVAEVSPSAAKTVHKNAPPGSSLDTLIRAQTIRTQQKEELRTALADKIVKKEAPLNDQETVINAFNSAFSLWEQIPENQLAPQERWARNSVRAAKEKTIDQGKNTFTNSFLDLETGETVTQEEGVPTESLLLFLQKKIDSLPPDSKDRDELSRIGSILYRNSQYFHSLPHRMEPARLLGRVRQEAYFISKDERATGNDFDNWLKAEKTLMNRLELILPQQETKPVPTPETPSIQSPASEQIAELEKVQPTEQTPAAEIRQEEISQSVEPQPETLEQIKREAHLINRIVDPEKRARELAEEQLNEEMRRGIIFNPLNWPRKIGMSIWRNWYRERYIERALKAIEDTGNTAVDIDLVRNVIRNADFQKEEVAAEEKEAIEQIKTGRLLEGEKVEEAQGALRDALLNEIMRPLVEGRITDTKEVQRKLREFVENHQDDPQVQALFGRDATQYGKLAYSFATDLSETAELIKQDIAANRYALEQLSEVVRIKLANARWGGETEAHFGMIDRAVAWAERNRLRGTLLNPATIGAAFSLGTFAFIRTTGLGAGAAGVLVPGAGLLPAAGFAAFRRNYDLKRDIAAHRAEREYGRPMSQEMPRREALERFAYNTASVKELIEGGGQEILTGTERKSLQELLRQDLSDGQVSNRADVIRRIAEIEARLDFSAREKVGLIIYEGRFKVRQGRTRLIKEVVQAKQVLRQAGMSDQEIQDLENNFKGEWNQKFTQNREQQDHAFRNYRLRNAAGAAAFGGAAGLAGGVVSQEGFAQIARHFPEVTNVPVIGAPFQKGETAIEGGLRRLGIEVPGAPSGPTVETYRNLYQQGGTVDLGDRFRVSVSATDHSVAIIDGQTSTPVPDVPKTQIETNGHLRTFGQLPQEAGDTFRAEDYEVRSGPPVVEPKITVLLDPKDGKYEDVITGGHKTVIPNKTQWIQDTTSPERWDLVVANQPDNVLINDARFEATGKLAGWETKHPLLEVASQGSEAQVIKGDSVVKEFEGMGTQIDKREWYAYDRPGSQGNELRLHTFKDKDAVVLDMSKMELGYQRGLNPNPINVQEAIKKGEAGFAFSLPWHEKTPIWILDSQDGALDGKLHLDPNDTINKVKLPNGREITLGEFTKMVINQEAFKPLPQGDIATEVFNRRDVFKLGLDGKNGFIEAGRIADQEGVRKLQAFATILGKGEAQVEVPGKFTSTINLLDRLEITKLVETPTFEIIPPLEHEAPPIIPIPFVPRHPLESLRPIVIPAPEYPYYPIGYELFRRPDGTPARLADIIRFRTPEAARAIREARTAPLSPAATSPTFEAEIITETERQEGKEALAAIRETFLKSTHVYVSFSGAIGDVALTSAYLEGLRLYSEKLGEAKKITVIVPSHIAPLLEPLAKKYNYELIAEERGKEASKARSLIDERIEENTLIFDFEHYGGRPAVDTLPRGGLAVNDLLAASVALYDNERSGSERFSEFFSDLLSIPQNQRVGIKPRLDLPDNSNQIFEQLKARYNFDLTKQQIAVVVEASHQMKRYSLANWKQILSRLSQEQPNTEFNIIFNPSGGSYNQQELRNALGGVPGARFVSGTLVEQTVLLSRQKLVLANDTGLAHIAAVVEGGPKVISLHLPIFPAKAWVSDTNRHQGLTAPFVADFNSEETDEDKKLINKISPDEVAQKALEILSPQPVPAQPRQAETLEATIAAEQPMGEKKFQAGAESIVSTEHPEQNEDNFFVNEELGAAGVFDGMGGMANAALASKTARERIEKDLLYFLRSTNPEYSSVVMGLRLSHVNDDVRKAAPGGGTTAVVVTIWTGKAGERKLVVGKIGDSRMWLRKADGTLVAITEDDSPLRRDFLSGHISEEQYKKIKTELDTAKTGNELTSLEAKGYFANRNLITRYLGKEKAEVETKIIDLDPGDLILLTSDGIHDNLTPQDINEVLNNLQTQTPQAVAKLLALRAQQVFKSEPQNIRGKSDDMTAVILKIP